ncbi:hypothetical protein LTR84_003210 [Exophiala bonariae]|uniref:ABC multidrug transporter MDR2 n=1 Tax=Exophiala bonariae TaxID=1690606 RepID=A0AAV9N809_9EURO|nr:hypothetical protein LTR84_003210 [Exophiala bonariae]
MKLLQNLGRYPRLLLAGDPSKAEIGTLLLGITCAIASGVPFPLIGIIFGQLLDDFNSATCNSPETSESASQYQNSVNDKILLILYLAIAQFITIYIHLTCWSLNGARLAQRLREQYIRNLLRQEPSYFDSLPPGEVSSRLNGDIQAIRSGTAEKVGICLSSVSFFITAYIVAFIKNHDLAAMLISLIPAYFLMSIVGSHYIEKYSALMSDYAATAASIASEALSNIVVVQAFGANVRLESKFSKALQSSEHEGLKKATAVGVQSGLLYFIAYSANGLAFWQGSKQIADSVRNDSTGTTVGATFTVIFILIEATLTLSMVAPFLHLFGGAVASYEKLQEDLYREPSINGTGDSGTRLDQADGALELKEVSFVYPSRADVTVLDRINIRIPANKHTAIVGQSGSGKSTITGLFMRLYDPTEGQILFDGIDLRAINVHDLRSFIGLVQQEASLLDRSILENIAHGLINTSNPQHSHLKSTLLSDRIGSLANQLRGGEDILAAAGKMGSEMVEIVNIVQKAAVLADANDFIQKLQHGYGTVVGSTGRLVSGGQKQRVALARALVKDPKVLILDEATAALDSSSERRIQEAISKIAVDRTVVTIAHRLATVTSADNIIVMHKGRVIEEGDHPTLMATSGAYAEMVRLQGLGVKGKEPYSEESDKQISSTVLTEQNSEKSSFSNDETGDPEKSEFLTHQVIVPALAEEQDEPFTPKRSVWSVLRGYAPALKPHILTITAALIGSTVVGGSFSGEAVIFGNTVGSLSPCNSEESIRSRGNFFGLMFFVLAIIEFFANIVSWSGFGWVSEKIVYTVRVLSFRSLFEQDIHWHQSEGRTPALLLSYITRDGSALSGLSGSVIGTLFSITINLIAAIVLTHIVAWKIALVCLSLVPLLLGAGLMELRVLGQFEERHENAYTKSVDIGVEAITSIKTVASLSLEEEILGTYRRSLKGPRKETFKVSLQASLWQAMTYLLGNLVNALAYWWGARQIIAGTYTQVQFLIVVFSLLVSALLWSQMFALAPELSSAKAAMVRILSLIDLGSDKMQGRLPRSSPTQTTKEEDLEVAAKSNVSREGSTTASSVRLQDVHFAYPARPDVKVLNGLSIDIKSGTFCAFVGPSGAGKSTIVSLIERLYSASAGNILIDGFDITGSRDVTFRDTIALVPQDSVLFEGDIAFNIGLGAKPGQDVSLDEIKEACKLANIHDTIEELPDGYDTLCGPNGNQFSGGQKQRLSIARALVRKPRLLILDEPTSALDAESEKLLQAGLDKAANGITVIAIAHRLHTIRRADTIFLIEEGKCLDQGTHEELLERSDSYRLNVMHQTLAE